VLVRGKRDVVDFHDPAAVVSRGASDGIDPLLDVQAQELPFVIAGRRSVPLQQLTAPDFSFYVRYTPLTFRWRQSTDTLLTLHTC
jgi:hypothetical protein